MIDVMDGDGDVLMGIAGGQEGLGLAEVRGWFFFRLKFFFMGLIFIAVHSSRYQRPPSGAYHCGNDRC